MVLRIIIRHALRSVYYNEGSHVYPIVTVVNLEGSQGAMEPPFSRVTTKFSLIIVAYSRSPCTGYSLHKSTP